MSHHTLVACRGRSSFLTLKSPNMGVTVGEAKEILGIAPEASDAEIEKLAKKAYRKLALKVG